jgi:hypothetical protein
MENAEIFGSLPQPRQGFRATGRLQMNRTYLFVPPEENAAVQALGAHQDTQSKCWYIDSEQDPARFCKWLPDAAEDEEFAIVSDQAYVAATTVPCVRCKRMIEVICIFCASGTVSGEPLTHFTISSPWTLDDALMRQLEPWPTFRPTREAGYFANHCPHCGALQDDMYLHTEPDQPFFNIPRAAPDSIKLTSLRGRIQLSGNESYEV